MSKLDLLCTVTTDVILMLWSMMVVSGIVWLTLHV